MHRLLSMLILVAVIAINAVAASAGGSAEIRPVFYGDGFDNTTCTETPRAHGC